jgi:hypothetical protein
LHTTLGVASFQKRRVIVMDFLRIDEDEDWEDDDFEDEEDEEGDDEEEED